MLLGNWCIKGCIWSTQLFNTIRRPSFVRVWREESECSVGNTFKLKSLRHGEKKKRKEKKVFLASNNNTLGWKTRKSPPTLKDGNWSKLILPHWLKLNSRCIRKSSHSYSISLYVHLHKSGSQTVKWNELKSTTQTFIWK